MLRLEMVQDALGAAPVVVELHALEVANLAGDLFRLVLEHFPYPTVLVFGRV